MNHLDIFKPSILKNLCAEYGFFPSKTFGQNYLINEKPVQQMIAAAGLKSDDTVLEIGPGFGALTLGMAPIAKKIIAYEIEVTLRPYWEPILKSNPNIEIVWGDAMNLMKPPEKKYKILANIPYQITAFAFRNFFKLNPLPTVIAVMVQKELAERICVEPGEKTKNTAISDGSVLSVLVHYFGTPKMVARVSRGSFWPSPKVDSAIIVITDIRARPDADRFMALVKAGFSHKRKIMLNNVASTFNFSPDAVKTAFGEAGIPAKARAESLAMNQWESLYRFL